MANISKSAVMGAAKTKLDKSVARWIVSRMGDYDGDARGVLKDLLYGGCSSGIVGGLVYYRDTVRFYKRHEADIWNLAIEQAEDMGAGNVFAYLASLNGAKDVGNADQSLNLLAWYAFEETARILADRLEIET